MPINQNVYFFGNSLVNYASGSSLSNVPVWMGRFAGADGNGFGAEGGYGFLRNFADTAEPSTDWSFEGVSDVYDASTSSFGSADFDAIVITPANFIQDQQPFENYFGEDRSPLEATIEIVNTMRAVQPDARLFVYEGWADMGAFAPSGAPTGPQLAAYHAYNQGEYHQWYETLVDVTNAETGSEVTLIPVASILSDLLDSAPLNQIPAGDLYVDSAPHGTETTYFLASMITYGAIYGEMPPPDFHISGPVHPLVQSYFPEITQDISDALSEAGFPNRIPQPGDDTGFANFFAGEGSGSGGSEAAQAPEPAELVTAAAPVTEEPVFEAPTAQDPEEEEQAEAFAAPTFAEPIEPAFEPADDDEDAPCFERTIDTGDGGPFTFSLTSDDPAELYVNGTLILQNDGSDPSASQDVTLNLPAGEMNLSVYYHEQDGGEILILDAGPALPSEIAGLPETTFDDAPDDLEEPELELF